MDSRQIAVFVAVMDRGSVTEAARTLGVTQPAISSVIAKLEAELGLRLFRREGRGVLPTQEARQLYPEASQALRGLHRVAAVASGIADATAGVLIVATNPSPAVSWLPKVAAAFQRTRPDVRVRFLTRASQEVRDMAVTGAFDLGVSEAPFGRPDLLVRRFRLPLLAAVHPRNPLAKHATITAALLHDQAFIATVASPWTWAAVTRALDGAGVTARIVAECEFMATALHMAGESEGLCLCDPASAGDARLRGLLLRPFEPTINYEIGILAPVRGGMTPLATAFASAMEGHLAEVLTESGSHTGT